MARAVDRRGADSGVSAAPVSSPWATLIGTLGDFRVRITLRRPHGRTRHVAEWPLSQSTSCIRRRQYLRAPHQQTGNRSTFSVPCRPQASHTRRRSRLRLASGRRIIDQFLPLLQKLQERADLSLVLLFRLAPVRLIRQAHHLQFVQGFVCGLVGIGRLWASCDKPELESLNSQPGLARTAFGGMVRFFRLVHFVQLNVSALSLPIASGQRYEARAPGQVEPSAQPSSPIVTGSAARLAALAQVELRQRAELADRGRQRGEARASVQVELSSAL